MKVLHRYRWLIVLAAVGMLVFLTLHWILLALLGFTCWRIFLHRTMPRRRSSGKGFLELALTAIGGYAAGRHKTPVSSSDDEIARAIREGRFQVKGN